MTDPREQRFESYDPADGPSTKEQQDLLAAHELPDKVLLRVLRERGRIVHLRAGNIAPAEYVSQGYPEDIQIEKIWAEMARALAKSTVENRDKYHLDVTMVSDDRLIGHKARRMDLDLYFVVKP